MSTGLNLLLCSFKYGKCISFETWKICKAFLLRQQRINSLTLPYLALTVCVSVPAELWHWDFSGGALLQAEGPAEPARWECCPCGLSTSTTQGTGFRTDRKERARNHSLRAQRVARPVSCPVFGCGRLLVSPWPSSAERSLLSEECLHLPEHSWRGDEALDLEQSSLVFPPSPCFPSSHTNTRPCGSEACRGVWPAISGLPQELLPWVLTVLGRQTRQAHRVTVICGLSQLLPPAFLQARRVRITC